MNRVQPNTKQLAVGASLFIGPLFAYLVWALLAHRWGHLALAAALNLALWTLGPLALSHALRVSHLQ